MTSGQAPTTRERILTGAGALFRRQGYTGTGLAQIAEESQARIGSIYHFFDNKDALGEEVVRTAGAAYGAMVMGVIVDGPDDPVDALGAAFVQAARDLEATDYADACPIATIALEVASTHESMRVATAEVFEAWTTGLTAWCGRITDDPDDARDLALAVLSQLEGAFVLARARRSREPLESAARSIVRLATALRTTPD